MKSVKPKVTSTTVGISSSNYAQRTEDWLELCAAEPDLKRQLIDQAAIQLLNSLRRSLKHETLQCNKPNS